MEDLSSAVRDLCGSHRRDQDGKPSSGVLHLLSDVCQEPYHQAEDAYLAELINYTKKQFFKVRNEDDWTLHARLLLLHTSSSIAPIWVMSANPESCSNIHK